MDHPKKPHKPDGWPYPPASDKRWHVKCPVCERMFPDVGKLTLHQFSRAHWRWSTR
jgi:hypothetical protein